MRSTSRTLSLTQKSRGKNLAVLSTSVTALRSAFGHKEIQTVNRIVISHAVPAERDYE